MARGGAAGDAHHGVSTRGEEDTARVTRALEARLASRVELEVVIDPAVIGGVVAMSEGQEIEFSIEGRLKALSESIKGR